MGRTSKKQTAAAALPYARALQLTMPCARCGAAAGERCKNYKGKGKSTCVTRGLNIPPAAPPPPPPEAVDLSKPTRQATLYEYLDPAESELPS